MVFSDDFLHFLKIKKKICHRVNTLKQYLCIKNQVLMEALFKLHFGGKLSLYPTCTFNLKRGKTSFEEISFRLILIWYAKRFPLHIMTVELPSLKLFLFCVERLVLKFDNLTYKDAIVNFLAFITKFTNILFSVKWRNYPQNPFRQLFFRTWE